MSYKYAFSNFDNFFIAPGVSYAFVNNDVKAGYSTSSSDAYSQVVTLDNQLNFQANFGYDACDQFAVYVCRSVFQFLATKSELLIEMVVS